MDSPGALPSGGLVFQLVSVVFIDTGHIAQSPQSGPRWSPAFKIEPVLFPPSEVLCEMLQKAMFRWGWGLTPWESLAWRLRCYDTGANRGRRAAPSAFSACSLCPCSHLLRWENHSPWCRTNSSEVIAGLFVCCQLSTNLFFRLDFNPSRAGTTSDASCVPHQPSFLSAGNCSMSVSWGGLKETCWEGNSWTGQPERRCWKKISEGTGGWREGYWVGAPALLL